MVCVGTSVYLSYQSTTSTTLFLLTALSGHEDTVQSLSWQGGAGALLATVCKVGCGCHDYSSLFSKCLQLHIGQS